jgi:hypothetical protein
MLWTAATLGSGNSESRVRLTISFRMSIAAAFPQIGETECEC